VFILKDYKIQCKLYKILLDHNFKFKVLKQKLNIMKTLFKIKIVMIIMIAGLLLSCKNNKDGYSDEIDTRQTPVDSVSSDTTNVKNGLNTTGTNSTGAAGTEFEGVTPAGSLSSPGKSPAQKTSTTGSGSEGPGPSAKDGATYDISTQSRKDTTRLGPKAKAKVLKEKETKK
jgi:hypothetical protein